MIELLQFSLCLLAFIYFSHAQFNHFRNIYGVRSDDKKRLCFLIIAWISILLSFTLCIYTQAGYGALLFCGYMALSALIIMLFCNFLVTWMQTLKRLNIAIVVLSGVYIGVL